MAFAAALDLDGTKYKVLHCSFALSRDIDPTGRPSSGVKGGTVSFEVEATDDVSLWSSLIDQFKRVKGSIIFKKDNEDSDMQKLEFEDAYVVQFAENFVSVGGNPMTVSFTISAKTLTLNSEPFENEWPA